MGIFPGRNEVGVLIRKPRTLETNFKTLGEARGQHQPMQGQGDRASKGQVEGRQWEVVGDSLEM